MAVKIDNQVAALQKRLTMIEDKLKEKRKAHIVIKDKAYPGVNIIIGTQHLTLSEELLGPKTISIVDDEIKVL